jgi:hypothetical protein
MASTYSPDLRIELIGNGDQSGTWGTTTNNNLGTIIEQAIAGTTSVSVTSSNQALTVVNGAPDQSRMAAITLTTAIGANFNIYAPPVSKLYVIFNNTSYVATIYNSTISGNTTPAGSGIAIPAGSTAGVWSDGTNFRIQNNNISLFTNGSLSVAQGGTGATSSTGSGSVVLNNSPTLVGTPTAPTAATGTNSTQIATTAFVVNATGTLGTMATQNANAVAITGGSISGVSVSASSVSTASATITGGTISNTTVNSNVVGSNSVGARTVSTSAPSGGSNGDIWYQV